MLESGERVEARKVIDCRGQGDALAHLEGGWQVFMGRHMRTQTPHGVTRPVIMDASVEQHDGYRFVYVLPLGAHDVFIEDTYYRDDPVLDRRALGARIDAFARAAGWDGQIVSNETGLLPVITGGDFGAFADTGAIPGVARAGVAGGFTHPLTSYTLPIAVENALLIAREIALPGDQLAALLRSRARAHWKGNGFYRLLARMLFGAAAPAERYRVLARFYTLPAGLVERFYAGTSTLRDRLRILAGRPPVPVSAALRALATHGDRLDTKDV
jgi:lycopene beta-cyclase